MQPFEKSRCVNHKHTDSLWTRCGLRDFCARNAILQNYACKVYCKFVREHTCTLYILVFYIQTILHIVYAMHVKHIFEMFQSKGPNNDPSASQIWNFSVAFSPHRNDWKTRRKHVARTLVGRSGWTPSQPLFLKVNRSRQGQNSNHNKGHLGSRYNHCL